MNYEKNLYVYLDSIKKKFDKIHKELIELDEDKDDTFLLEEYDRLQDKIALVNDAIQMHEYNLQLQQDWEDLKANWPA